MSDHLRGSAPKRKQGNSPEKGQESKDRPPNLDRRCPRCFGNWGGLGVVKSHYRVSGRTQRYHYVCKLCGHDWTFDKIVVPVEKPVVAHQDVDIEAR